MTSLFLPRISILLFFLLTSVFSTSPALDIPWDRINAPTPSFTITEVFNLNGEATLLPSPNSSPKLSSTPSIDPFIFSPALKPPSKDGEIAQHANPQPLAAGEISQTTTRKGEVADKAVDTSASSSFLQDSIFQSSVLNSTKSIRALHAASALAWNTTLATYAQNYSSRCRFHPSSSPFGEILAADKDNVTSAVESWTLPFLLSLKTDLSNLNLTALDNDIKAEQAEALKGADQANLNLDLTNSLNTFPKEMLQEWELKKLKTFTQLIWKNTTRIGCGRTLCGGQNGVNGWLVVCEFDPKGNVIGQYGANVQLLPSNSSASPGASGTTAGGQIGSGKARPNEGGIGEVKIGAAGRVVHTPWVWGSLGLVWTVLMAVLS